MSSYSLTGQDRYRRTASIQDGFAGRLQNATTPESKRGREIIEHERRGIAIHLFVRDGRRAGGKAAPFVYHGQVAYESHQGSGPVSVVFSL